MTPHTLEAARRLHLGGRLREALEAYRDLTDAQPAAFEPWQFRAMAEQQIGNLEAARSSIARSIELNAGRAEAHLVAGHIAQDLGEFAPAESSFRRALELRPDWVAALNSLGLLLTDCGRAQEALGVFQRSVEIDGKGVRGWNGLGAALVAQERVDEAIRALNYSVSLEPRYASPHFNLGRAYQLLGQNDRALSNVRVAVQLEPRNSEFRFLLGELLRKTGDLEGARLAYAASGELAPEAPGPANALAELRWELGEETEARLLFDATFRRHPESFAAAAGSRLLLPAVYEGAGELARARDAYEEGLGELLEDPARFRWASAAEALRDLTWTNFHLAYQGRSDRDLQRSYGELVQEALRPVAPELLAPRAWRARHGRRPRVGFFSHFFHNCTVGRYFGSWIQDLDRARFETVVFHTNPWVAEDTRAIAAAADRFQHLPARTVHDLAKRVLAEDLDVLVYPELGMNSATFALASLRLAPVQVAGWGHPTTTGLPTIDWFLSCAPMESDEAPSHYTERLATLPGLGTRYARPSAPARLTRETHGFAARDHLYLVPQSLFKVHPDNDALFAEILARDPAARLVMFASPRNALNERFTRRLEPRLQAIGTSVGERIVLLPFQPHSAFLGINGFCDVMLDTLHWSGGNTSLDALSCGLPVVTLPGTLMRGRQSMAMLRMIGVPELIARDVEDYADKAIAVASDKSSREQISRRIVANLGEIFNRMEPIRAFEDFLERVSSSELSP